LTVAAAADQPVLGAGGTLAYDESQIATVIDATVSVVSDADDTHIASATATISAGLTTGDVLGFTTLHGITGTYDAATGVLTLTGNATLAQYQAALRTVTYRSTSETPTQTSTSRTITWQVTDADSDSTAPAISDAVTSTVTITAVNDTPVLTGADPA